MYIYIRNIKNTFSKKMPLNKRDREITWMRGGESDFIEEQSLRKYKADDSWIKKVQHWVLSSLPFPNFFPTDLKSIL